MLKKKLLLFSNTIYYVQLNQFDHKHTKGIYKAIKNFAFSNTLFWFSYLILEWYKVFFRYLSYNFTLVWFYMAPFINILSVLFWFLGRFCHWNWGSRIEHRSPGQSNGLPLDLWTWSGWFQLNFHHKVLKLHSVNLKIQLWEKNQ